MAVNLTDKQSLTAPKAVMTTDFGDLGEAIMDRGRVTLDEYGYTCSACAHMDTFNEESLLETPPTDILTVKLLRMYRSAAHADPADVKHLRHSRRQCTLHHTIACARRDRHLPIACADMGDHRCFRSEHWRFCSGFYKVKLMVEYIISSMGEAEQRHHISCVRVCQILPNCEAASVSSFELHKDGTVTSSSDEAYLDLSQTNGLLRAKDRCRTLMDYLFCMDCRFSAINGFTFLTNPRERAVILEDMIILQRALHFHSKSLAKFTLTGVLLHCNGEHLSLQSQEDYASRALFLHTDNVCRNLYSRRKAFTPKLFFHSYEIYRGSFGRKKIHVTLVLTSKTNKEVQEFCEEYFEPLSIRSNPFLQISPCLKVIRKAETLDPSVGLYIRLIFAGNFLLNECTSTMNTL